MSLLEEWEMKEGNAASLDALITMIENIDNRPALDVVKDVRGKFLTLLYYTYLAHVLFNIALSFRQLTSKIALNF